MGILCRDSSRGGRGCFKGCGRPSKRRCRICGKEWDDKRPTCGCRRRGFCRRMM